MACIEPKCPLFQTMSSLLRSKTESGPHKEGSTPTNLYKGENIQSGVWCWVSQEQQLVWHNVSLIAGVILLLCASLQQCSAFLSLGHKHVLQISVPAADLSPVAPSPPCRSPPALVVAPAVWLSAASAYPLPCLRQQNQLVSDRETKTRSLNSWALFLFPSLSDHKTISTIDPWCLRSSGEMTEMPIFVFMENGR